jgi:hypothetical protein
MCTREKIMSLKIGDKVKMTQRGFRYYSNIDNAFDSHCVGRSMDSKHFTSAVCELFAIHGVGTVESFGIFKQPYIRWDYSLDGIKYHYTHYFDLKDIRKLTSLERVAEKLKGVFQC